MPDESYDLTSLREFLVAHFDLEELRTLCFDLGVDFDSLPGQGKAGKARELVRYIRRHSRLDDLVAVLQRLRAEAWNERVI